MQPWHDARLGRSDGDWAGHVRHATLSAAMALAAVWSEQAAAAVLARTDMAAMVCIRLL